LAQWSRVSDKEQKVSEEIVIHLGQDALRTLALLSAPLLLSTLVVGLVISIFQALTQIKKTL